MLGADKGGQTLLGLVVMTGLTAKAYVGAVFASPDRFTLKIFDRSLSVIGQCSTKPHFIVPNEIWKSTHNEFQRSGVAFRVDGSRHKIYEIEVARTFPGKSGEREGWFSQSFLQTFDFSGNLLKRVEMQIDWQYLHFLGFSPSGAEVIRQDMEGKVFWRFTESKWKRLVSGNVLADFRINIPLPSRVAQFRDSVEDWRKISRMSYVTPYNNNYRWVEIDLWPLTDSLTNDLGTAGIGSAAFGVYSERTITASWNKSRLEYNVPDGEYMQYVHLLDGEKILYTGGESKLVPDFAEYQIFPRPPFSLSLGRIVDLKTKSVSEIPGASYCFPIL